MTSPGLLAVVDGNHLIHRAFHAIQAPLATRSGEPTNALYGFAGMMLNILEKEHPTHLVVAFDEKAPTFRHEAHAGYKGTRVKAPDALYAQIPRIREMIAAWKVPSYSLAGFEADDLMGTLALEGAKQGMKTLLITGDRDVLQLINDRVHVVFPHKGYREPEVYDAAMVEKNFGVRPDQFVDYKALVGDASDNLAGVDGIGPKRAAELLSRYGTLDGIYAHLADIPAAVRGKLLAGKESAYFTQKLAAIRTDVPCDTDFKAARVEHLDYAGLRQFFAKMEMKSLENRLARSISAEKLADREQLSLF